MSRTRLRGSRALRVLLACLALWLPAQRAHASWAPGDAVVVVAHAARAEVEPRPPAVHAPSKARRAAAHRTAEVGLVSAPTAISRRPREWRRGAALPALYLQNCALLR